MSDYQLDQELNKQEAPVIEPEVQEVEQQVESDEPEDQEVASIPQPSPETHQAKNFRQLKEQKYQVERERDDLARKLADLEASRQQPEEDYDINLGEDELAEGKHIRKVGSKIKRLEQQLQQYQQQSNLSAIELRLKSQYPDIDKIVSPENLELLQATYPEISSTLGATNDLHAKAVSAYILIKKLGIAQDDNFVADRARAQKNAAKPRPLASVSPQQGDSPLSRANAFANGLTEELQQQLRKEMNDARKAM